jgi:hypothetical protein
MKRIDNREYRINRSELTCIEELPGLLEKKADGGLLRWYISKVTADQIFVEVTLYREEPGPVQGDGGVEGVFYPGKQVVVSIVPTGIGCALGGYAADAAPAAALLASCTDYLITNPNTVNASDFIRMSDNILYTEGFIIDLFCRGRVNLYKPYANKVGVIIEKAGKKELEVVFNLINTARAVHGIDIHDWVITDELIGGRCVQTQSGCYAGEIENPGVLFKACEALLARGVNAIAVTSNIKDLPLDNYARHFDGQHPNPVGGAEAVLSHLVCKKYRVPSAHAPMINVKDLALSSGIVDARGAGEFASASGLACVLIGLAQAPQLMPDKGYRCKDVVNIENLMAVIAPASALGGIPVLYAARRGIPVIAVKNNHTILEVTQEKLNLKQVIEVTNYAEAAGILQALANGISIASIDRPLQTLRPNGM